MTSDIGCRCLSATRIDEFAIGSYTAPELFEFLSSKVPHVSDPLPKPMNADEIEAMLRTAREYESKNRSDIVSDEPLGPGDVQHLQNSSHDDPPSAHEFWPYASASAEETLNQAEQHLAAAMSPEGVSARESVSPPAAEFQAFAPTSHAAPRSPLGPSGLPLSVVGDIEVDVTLELGGAELTIEDLLALREGSVVTLDKEAGEPIDILANGRLIARGEVIVVDDKFCVRICEVIGS